MGNRAVIAFSTEARAPAIYLHWNGGRASVQGFLDAARELGMRSVPTAGRHEYRADYAPQARCLDWIAQEVMARAFFGCDVGFTVYREEYGRADKDNGDNGTYILNPHDLSIDRRIYVRGGEEYDAAKQSEITAHIMQRAPAFNG